MEGRISDDENRSSTSLSHFYLMAVFTVWFQLLEALLTVMWRNSCWKYLLHWIQDMQMKTIKSQYFWLKTWNYIKIMCINNMHIEISPSGADIGYNVQWNKSPAQHQHWNLHFISLFHHWNILGHYGQLWCTKLILSIVWKKEVHSHYY